MAQFWEIIRITTEVNLLRKTNAILVQFWTIIYMPSEFSFCKSLQIWFLKKINIGLRQFSVIT